MISVIIPAFNEAANIAECILAVLNQSAPLESYEVIVVDDGSSDATAPIARSHRVRVISQDHQGTAAARNAGARISAGNILLFVDADCAPALDWIEQMTAPFSDPSIVGVKGAYRTHQTGLMARFVQAEYESKYDRLAKAEPMDFIDGYSAAYRRSVFAKAGGFDPTLSAAEDVELSYRLSGAGYRLVFNPKAIVFHKHGTTLGRYLQRKMRYGLWRGLVYQRFPDKARGDAHTPVELRFQIPAAGVTVGLAAASLKWPRLRPVTGLAAALFAASTAPFVARSRKCGLDVATAAPALLFARALALGAGLTIALATVAAENTSRDLVRIARDLFARER